MDAKYLAFYDSTNAEIIKDFCAIFPRICVAVFSNDLIVEAIHGSNLSSFVVAPQESDMSWEFQLEAKQVLKGLN